MWVKPFPFTCIMVYDDADDTADVIPALFGAPPTHPLPLRRPHTPADRCHVCPLSPSLHSQVRAAEQAPRHRRQAPAPPGCAYPSSRTRTRVRARCGWRLARLRGMPDCAVCAPRLLVAPSLPLSPSLLPPQVRALAGCQVHFPITRIETHSIPDGTETTRDAEGNTVTKQRFANVQVEMRYTSGTVRVKGNKNKEWAAGFNASINYNDGIGHARAPHTGQMHEVHGSCSVGTCSELVWVAVWPSCGVPRAVAWWLCAAVARHPILPC